MNVQFVFERINKMCKAAHITVKEMELRSDVGINTVDNMKKGSCPSIIKIEKIADFFQLKIDDIIHQQPNDENIFTFILSFL